LPRRIATQAPFSTAWRAHFGKTLNLPWSWSPKQHPSRTSRYCSFDSRWTALGQREKRDHKKSAPTTGMPAGRSSPKGKAAERISNLKRTLPRPRIKRARSLPLLQKPVSEAQRVRPPQRKMRRSRQSSLRPKRSCKKRKTRGGKRKRRESSRSPKTTPLPRSRSTSALPKSSRGSSVNSP
jgi:hypothetical protein